MHAFPGNVRELRNVLERAALLCDGRTLGTEHIERALDAAAPPLPSKAMPQGAASLRALEREALRRQLQAHHGSRAELARALGISERTLYRKLQRLEDAA